MAVKYVKLTLTVKEEKDGIDDGQTHTIPKKFEFSDLKEMGVSVNVMFKRAVNELYAELQDYAGSEEVWDIDQASLEDF